MSFHISTDSSNSAQHISFSVFLNSRHVIPLGARQTVKYDGVLTNDGNGYYDRTGVFTCPLAGTYMFLVDSLSFPGTWLDLKVNKNKVGRLHVSSAHKGNPIIQISRTIIVKLKTGDHVKVENEHNKGTIHPAMYSGFTGVRMYWPRIYYGIKRCIPSILIESNTLSNNYTEINEILKSVFCHFLFKAYIK